MILSAGSYNSPQLLQLSGVGPAGLLTSHGIPVRHALAGVGENLRDHYAPRFTVRVKNIDTINERARGLKLVREVIRYVTTRKGILSLSPTLVYCFWRSDPSVANSDLQLTFTPASYREGVQGQLDLEPGMTVASWQQRPDSRGYVRLRSADPFDPPMIQPNYLAEDSDRRVLLAGMKLARRLLETKPLEPYVDYEDFPGDKVQTDDELMGAAKERGTTTFHPAGTCRMGPTSDPLAVVDDELRVHGLEGLRVIDASIMPTMLSANLNAATLMIADKASDLIRGRTPPEPIVWAGLKGVGRRNGAIRCTPYCALLPPPLKSRTRCRSFPSRRSGWGRGRRGRRPPWGSGWRPCAPRPAGGAPRPRPARAWPRASGRGAARGLGSASVQAWRPSATQASCRALAVRRHQYHIMGDPLTANRQPRPRTDRCR